LAASRQQGAGHGHRKKRRQKQRQRATPNDPTVYTRQKIYLHRNGTSITAAHGSKRLEK
jgi:hypothetical protein